MFILYADKNAMAVRKKELLTSGAVNVNTVQFGFSPDWEGLTKTAVFKAGSDTFSTLLTAPECFLPWEVLAVPNRTLYAGVYGTRGGELVIPTVWASLGEIQEGAKLGEDAKEPTPSVYEQITGELAGKADSIGYTESGELGLFAGDRLLKSVPISEGGGSGIPGPEGPPGPPGKDGEPGPPGADGKSAYQIAVGNGFTGTEDEWLASLKGEPGPPGENASAENIYSLEEQKIGTWIDGKPLYRKVIEVVIPSATGPTAVSERIPNAIVRMIQCYGNLKDGIVEMLPTINMSSKVVKCFYNWTDSTLEGVPPGLSFGVQNTLYYGRPAVVILEYTKTTD